jgi:hypothetical protein
MYDKIIIGAGLYGLYAALFCGKRGEEVIVLEHDSSPFERATYVNQARVHMGYHYPRSISTAIKSRGYFDRFNEEYEFCINSKFEKIYAISSNFSWTSAEQFRKFCKDADIRCEEISNDTFFKPGLCEGTFITTEYTYDAQILKNWFLSQIEKLPNIKIKYNARIENIKNNGEYYVFNLSNNKELKTSFVVNATYAGINQIHAMLNFPMLQIKYELCELIICKPVDKLKGVGITVMDGEFFSIMPFGKTGYHSLYSVQFSPHATSFESVPYFKCQANSDGYCSPQRLGNCNICSAKPETALPYMGSLARKYLKEEYGFEYLHSIFSMKPILKASEMDDSRPTVIRTYSNNPKFISVLSGKINTVYELEEEL